MYVYFHYLPSILRLHIHFTNIKAKHNSKVETTICTAWPFDSVIQNIELVPGYYDVISMPVLVNMKYFKRMIENPNIQEEHHSKK